MAANTAIAIRNIPLDVNHLRELYQRYPDVLHALGKIWTRDESKYYHDIGNYAASIVMGLSSNPPGCAILPRQQNALEDFASKMTLKDALAEYDVYRARYPEDYADMILKVHRRTMKIICQSFDKSKTRRKGLNCVDSEKMMKGRKGVVCSLSEPPRKKDHAEEQREEQRRRDIIDKLAKNRLSMKNFFKVYLDKKTNTRHVNPTKSVLKKLGDNAVLIS